jgi:hypothetical protein
MYTFATLSVRMHTNLSMPQILRPRTTNRADAGELGRGHSEPGRSWPRPAADHVQRNNLAGQLLTLLARRPGRGQAVGLAATCR